MEAEEGEVEAGEIETIQEGGGPPLEAGDMETNQEGAGPPLEAHPVTHPHPVTPPVTHRMDTRTTLHAGAGKTVGG